MCDRLRDTHAVVHRTLLTLLVVALASSCGDAPPLRGVVEEWEYELVLDALTDRTADDAPVVTAAGSMVTVRWVPSGCPFEVDAQFMGTANADIGVAVTYEATGDCPSVPVESILRFRTANPLPGESAGVDVEIIELR